MILFKKDTKNKIRFLEIIADKNELVQISGIVGTENPVEHRKICKAKNVGKSNSTTPEKQAIKEAEALVKDKLTEGYFKTVEEAESELVILPMLAKSYDDEKHKIDWSNCYIQPKLDGMRCLAFVKETGEVTLLSRDGKVIQNMDYIIQDLSTLKEDVILDGELYAHGLSFQENMKLIKKLSDDTKKIKYHIYDLVSDKPFKDRKVRHYVKKLFTALEVSTYEIKNEATLKEIHQSNLFNGYEGSIIRWGNDGYKINGRSSNLLKYKDFQDITATIIDIIPNDAIPTHGTPVLKFINKKMSNTEFTFKAGVKMSHADREELLLNRDFYIGKTAEIRFFEYTDDGIPRFPVMVGIRLDK